MSEVADVNKFYTVISETHGDMSLCSNMENTINNCASPFGLPDSNHINITVRRVSQIANGSRHAAITADDDSHHRSRKQTAENPPRNADVITGEVGSQLQESRPGKL